MFEGPLLLHLEKTSVASYGGPPVEDLEMNSVQTGLEALVNGACPALQGKSLGLLVNPASVDRRFDPSSLVIDRVFPDHIKALFTPQHGYYGAKQDNMVPSEDTTDPLLGVPVFSLYGQGRKPTEETLEPIDTLVIDLQDVGCRVYTFIHTMALCMEAAAEHQKAIVVLDRPNPLGGESMEGNCLKPECLSFVGMYPIPMRHGLTMGEMALLLNKHFGIGCDLTVVPMKGWKREMLFEDTGLPWVAPSPNLPTPNSAKVYPGQVLWEGTTLSEGRGTTKPFEVFGAPFLDVYRLKDRLSRRDLAGVHLRPLAFEPAWNKWKGRLCHGFQLHVLQPKRYRPYEISLTILQGVFSLHPDEFQWKPPPYEYEFEKLPFDLIAGDPRVRKTLEAGGPEGSWEEMWADELKAFAQFRRDYLLYT
jgi:uncharacterized protein YbbC (DUF1343 family)